MKPNGIDPHPNARRRPVRDWRRHCAFELYNVPGCECEHCWSTGSRRIVREVPAPVHRVRRCRRATKEREDEEEEEDDDNDEEEESSCSGCVIL